MDQIHLGDNISRLRHQKKITQEELARFMGVTKASVSKWETNQSLPDILLLPQLASFFDISVDELLGYKPQLSKEQIQKYYFDFAAQFASEAFEEVMEKSEVLVKKYYSCYGFLLQICVLWLNHCHMASTQARQIEILKRIAEICSHITSHCLDNGICNDAIMLKAMCQLQYGEIDDVIMVLEEMLNPYHFFHQGESILIQAYQMKGQFQQAHQFTQFEIYTHLMEFINLSIHYLSIHVQDLQRCEETIKRLDEVIKTYHIEKLNPNTTAQFYYQCAIVYCQHQNDQQALERLTDFVRLVCEMMEGDHILLHGDQYFDQIHIYFEQSDLGVHPVRNKKLILQSALQALEVAELNGLKEDHCLQSLKLQLKRKGETL